MLGKTNTMFVAADESASIQMVTEHILTPSASDIIKIEFLNDRYIAFLSDDKVLMGTDINSLSIVVKEGSPLLASHVIHMDSKYYFSSVARDSDAVTSTNASVYVTQNFIDFQTIQIYEKANFIGLYKTGLEKAVIIISKKLSGDTSENFYMSVLNSLEGYEESAAVFFRIQVKSIDGYYAKISRIIKEKIFVYTAATKSSLAIQVIISLDGTVKEAEAQMMGYANGYFFSLTSQYQLYYSVNGVDYGYLGNLPDAITNFFIAEYEDGAIGLFFKQSEVQKFTIAETPAKLMEALSKAVDATIIGELRSCINKGMYTYIGCTGGTIIKTNIDYSGSGNIPDVTVIKTLSAKQALEKANQYTDVKMKELADRIAALETAF